MKLTNEQIEARAWLKNFIKPTTCLIIVQKSVSRSGMQRNLEIYTMGKNGYLQGWTPHINRLFGYKTSKPWTLKVKGCGMDMHFWTANMITWYLWGKDKPKKLKGNGGGKVRCLEWQSI